MLVSTMERLSADDLTRFLRTHLPSDIVKKLRDQNITGADFLSLDSALLKDHGFSLGHVLAILRLQRDVNSDRISLVARTDSDHQELASSDALTEHLDRRSNDDDAELSDSCLLEYMDQVKIDALQSYEKTNLKAHVRNHRRMIAQGLPCGSVPTVFRRPPQHARSSRSVRVNTPALPTRNSARLSKRPLMPSNSQSASNDQDKTSSSSDEAVEDETPENVRQMYKPSLLKRSKEELLAIKPHLLPVFELDSVLDCGKTKKLLKHLTDGYVLTNKDRKLVYRTLVRHLCWKFMKNPNEVTGDLMERLAKSFCVQFIQYQKPIDVGEKTPWSHIFTPGGKGNFGNILKRIQSALPQEERKRKSKSKKKRSEANSEREEMARAKEVNVEALSLIFPGRGERESILDGMKVTYPLRKVDRARGKTIAFFILTYPHFMNYQGELITQEFSLICPKAQDMCPIFQSHIPTILDEWKTAVAVSKCGDETIDACLTVAHKLPHVIQVCNDVFSEEEAESSVQSLISEEELLIVIQPSDDVEEVIVNRVEASNGAIQPYLIAVKSPASSSTSSGFLKFFLALDGRAMELGRIPTIRAIDWVFKACVTFNVCYPPSWANFFRLLQTCYYQVFFRNEDDAPSSAVQVFKYLQKA